MKKIVKMLVIFSCLSFNLNTADLSCKEIVAVGSGQSQEVAPLTNAQQYVIVKNIAEIEGVESGISDREMVIEKCKDVLRIIGKRMLHAWYWMLKKIGF